MVSWPGSVIATRFAGRVMDTWDLFVNELVVDAPPIEAPDGAPSGGFVVDAGGFVVVAGGFVGWVAGLVGSAGFVGSVVVGCVESVGFVGSVVVVVVVCCAAASASALQRWYIHFMSWGHLIQSTSYSLF